MQYYPLFYNVYAGKGVLFRADGLFFPGGASRIGGQADKCDEGIPSVGTPSSGCFPMQAYNQMDSSLRTLTSSFLMGLSFLMALMKGT